MKVSIIIPVYNTGERLRRCLDSVIGQTFADFECIVVDDGSTDYSPKVIDEYAEKDNRFVVIHKENGGVSSARNVGLDKAQGEWVVFVDSDDILKKHHIEIMFSNVSPQIDFVYTSWEAIKHNGRIYRKTIDKCYLGKKQLRTFLCESEILNNMMPWGKIFRRTIIERKRLRFDTHLSISEDRLFCYSYLLETKGAVTLSDISYIHDASDNTSLSNRSCSVDVCVYRYKVFVKPTLRLLEQFEISSDDSLGLWKYLWSLLMAVIYSMSSAKGNIITITKKQKRFFSQNFCWSLYDLVKCSERVQTFMRQSENRLVFRQHFLIYNLKSYVRNLLFNFHVFK